MQKANKLAQILIRVRRLKGLETETMQIVNLLLGTNFSVKLVSVALYRKPIIL